MMDTCHVGAFAGVIRPRKRGTLTASAKRAWILTVSTCLFASGFVCRSGSEWGRERQVDAQDAWPQLFEFDIGPAPVRQWGVPVNSTHPEYDASAGAWSQARDVLAGGSAVKAAGERYVPRLDIQTMEEFTAYLVRAFFFNATARTAEGYLGLIFRRPPVVRLAGSGEQGAGVPGCQVGHRDAVRAGVEPKK
jgi:hypothetical protein